MFTFSYGIPRGKKLLMSFIINMLDPKTNCVRIQRRANLGELIQTALIDQFKIYVPIFYSELIQIHLFIAKKSHIIYRQNLNNFNNVKNEDLVQG